MDIRIRHFEERDYPQTVEINNSVFPEYPDTEDEWRHWDSHRDAKCKFQRWVIEGNAPGHLLGFGGYEQYIGMYHPRKFMLGMAVRPECQGFGLGAALYDEIMAALETFEPLVVRARTRADMSRSMRFLGDRGFNEEMRDWESRLDVTTFDFTPYEGHVERVQASGIRIATLAELAADPDRDRKLYELEKELEQDVPSPDQITPITFEYFLEHRLGSPNLLPDAFFVAIDSEQYVGLSGLWHSHGHADLYTGLTGVRRSHRRRGIALALKLLGIEYAREQGRTVIKTWNESNNRAMLSINERLGYRKQPAWVNFAKVLREE